MTKFEKRFFNILCEQDEEKQAFEDSLDKGTNPADFDVEQQATGASDTTLKVSQAINERNQEMRQQLESWVSRLDEFLNYLNGQTEGSIQTQLANAEADTIFDRMKQSEQRKIARVATELAALNESFRGYLAQTNNPQFKYV